MDAVAAANGARRGRREVYVRVQMCEQMCHVSGCERERCVRVCACVRVYVCVRVCVCTRACVFVKFYSQHLTTEVGSLQVASSPAYWLFTCITVFTASNAILIKSWLLLLFTQVPKHWRSYSFVVTSSASWGVPFGFGACPCGSRPCDTWWTNNRVLRYLLDKQQNLAMPVRQATACCGTCQTNNSILRYLSDKQQRLAIPVDKQQHLAIPVDKQQHLAIPVDKQQHLAIPVRQTKVSCDTCR